MLSIEYDRVQQEYNNYVKAFNNLNKQLCNKIEEIEDFYKCYDLKIIEKEEKLN